MHLFGFCQHPFIFTDCIPGFVRFISFVCLYFLQHPFVIVEGIPRIYLMQVFILFLLVSTLLSYGGYTRFYVFISLYVVICIQYLFIIAEGIPRCYYIFFIRFIYQGYQCGGFLPKFILLGFFAGVITCIFTFTLHAKVIVYISLIGNLCFHICLLLMLKVQFADISISLIILAELKFLMCFSYTQ